MEKWFFIWKELHKFRRLWKHEKKFVWLNWPGSWRLKFPFFNDILEFSTRFSSSTIWMVKEEKAYRALRASFQFHLQNDAGSSYEKKLFTHVSAHVWIFTISELHDVKTKLIEIEALKLKTSMLLAVCYIRAQRTPSRYFLFFPSLLHRFNDKLSRKLVTNIRPRFLVSYKQKCKIKSVCYSSRNSLSSPGCNVQIIRFPPNYFSASFRAGIYSVWTCLIRY